MENQKISMEKRVKVRESASMVEASRVSEYKPMLSLLEDLVAEVETLNASSSWLYKLLVGGIPPTELKSEKQTEFTVPGVLVTLLKEIRKTNETVNDIMASIGDH